MSVILRPILVATVLLMPPLAALANSPPAPPVILEPAAGSIDLSPDDVHMVTASLDDPNADDAHACSDWEIREAEGDRLVWSAPCAPGPLALHIHLGDGSYHEVSALSNDASYVLRVRHRDDSGEAESEWSLWSEREFATGPPVSIFPMRLGAVLDDPAPSWIDAAGALIRAVDDPDDPSIVLADLGGAILVNLGGEPTGPSSGGGSDESHQPLMLFVRAGEKKVEIPESVLEIHDETLRRRQIFVPAMTLAPGAGAKFWIATDGSTYHAGGESVPWFGSLARGGPVPWRAADRSLRIERVATGFQLPVALAFAPERDEPDAPWLYVAELYGSIRVIARDGSISDYASGLLEFGAEGPFPGAGEQGIGGMTVDPQTGDLFVTLPQPGESGHPVPRVIRLHSEDGGRTAAGQTRVLELTGIPHVPSHQISEITIGPDGMLYVHVGDGGATESSRDLDSFFGKILRIAPDGSAPADNPFHDSGDGISARDYVYAYGLRNPFGGAWRARDASLHAVDNGPAFDRIVRVVPGGDFGWDGTDDSIIANSLYYWHRAVAPVRITFLEPERFSGSGFPGGWMDRAIVTESGPTWAEGPQWVGKRLSLFRFAPDGSIASASELARYVGSGRGTAAALAAGPDGIYFSDLYRDVGAAGPFDPGASIFRIRFVGSARFRLERTDDAPLTVEVVDTSDLPNVTSREWTFGGESTVHGPAASHTFPAPGVYPIRLSVESDAGDSVAGAPILIGRTKGSGLRGDYFIGESLEGKPSLTRVDPRLDLDWDLGSPHPSLPADWFTVRWTGTLQALVTGEHRFHASSDDGIRVWIDGELIINDWGIRSSTESLGAAWLEAGHHHSIRIEYLEAVGRASMKLLWSSPVHDAEPIPTSVLNPPVPSRERPSSRRRQRPVAPGGD
ncbi:MAG TPA: PQQ-dependent sugar dehydrogenase [Thermoanaerobaculia bacterium]|nr:PQQ-dependent sugar dehydrogenase [Thermoanaerobaculia bacterium]